MNNYDVIIIGAGSIGLALLRSSRSGSQLFDFWKKDVWSTLSTTIPLT
jgi:NADH/NAD ratio-sensing transcriptional regulator Rex